MAKSAATVRVCKKRQVAGVLIIRSAYDLEDSLDAAEGKQKRRKTPKRTSRSEEEETMAI